MAITININNLTLIHKDSGGVAKATLPDICMTPAPGGPVPRKYSNTAYSKDIAEGTVTITADGGNMCANRGSQFSKSYGDEPGTLGGIISGTNMAEATWLTWSPDVLLEGRNACRLTDKMLMNHGNTICAAGVINPLIPPDDPKCRKIFEQIFDDLFAQKEGSWGGKRGMVQMWKNYAQTGSPRGPQPNGEASRFMNNHMNEYRKGQKNLRDKIKRWDDRNCNDKDNSGDGAKLVEKAQAYVDNEPKWASGILEPPMSEAAASINMAAAGKAAVATGKIVFAIIVITRIIRFIIPALWPLEASPV